MAVIGYRLLVIGYWALGQNGFEETRDVTAAGQQLNPSQPF